MNFKNCIPIESPNVLEMLQGLFYNKLLDENQILLLSYVYESLMNEKKINEKQKVSLTFFLAQFFSSQQKVVTFFQEDFLKPALKDFYQGIAENVWEPMISSKPCEKTLLVYQKKVSRYYFQTFKDYSVQKKAFSLVKNLSNVQWLSIYLNSKNNVIHSLENVQCDSLNAENFVHFVCQDHQIEFLKNQCKGNIINVDFYHLSKFCYYLDRIKLSDTICFWDIPFYSQNFLNIVEKISKEHKVFFFDKPYKVNNTFQKLETVFKGKQTKNLTIVKSSFHQVDEIVEDFSDKLWKWVEQYQMNVIKQRFAIISKLGEPKIKKNNLKFIIAELKQAGLFENQSQIFCHQFDRVVLKLQAKIYFLLRKNFSEMIRQKWILGSLVTLKKSYPEFGLLKGTMGILIGKAVDKAQVLFENQDQEARVFDLIHFETEISNTFIQSKIEEGGTIKNTLFLSNKFYRANNFQALTWETQKSLTTFEYHLAF